jgi:hypothetical protein
LDERIHLRENFRQLKCAYSNQHDKILEAYFYGLEMNAHNLTITWLPPWRESFWQKLILILSRLFSNYGSSFLRPLLGILVSTWCILLLLIGIYNHHGLAIVFPQNADSEALKIAAEEYFQLLNPFHETDESLHGWALMWDLLSRVLSSYFIYSLIRSTRRFLR